MFKKLFAKENNFLRKLSKENEEKRKKLLSPQSKQELLKEKLRKSTSFFKDTFSFLFSENLKIDEELREKISENLIKLDFGIFLAEKLSVEITRKISENKEQEVKKIFKEVLKNFYLKTENNFSVNISKDKTNIFLMTGANGSGKTTTIAKLAYKYKKENYKILLVAADTFRAGAVEQLKNWAEKLNLQIVLPVKDKEDPSALIYKSLKMAEDEKFDLIICDTSGKQHNNENLMRELEKIYKTIHKFNVSAPHESFLVIDSTIGQSSFFQAEKFLKKANISGIILSKMDTLTRGGTIFFIKDKFNIPVKYIGTGEKLEDFHEFNLDQIIDFWISEWPSKEEMSSL